ncbi:MAG: MerR family transcriptional regulator [Moraxellaceae bacterium]|nr:MerR family transcriptional regulator [Moraxellaceae bacterium]
MKTPQTLLKQLLKQGRDLLPDMGSSAAPSGQEHTIDELARAAGTTVRNVRAYQDRGLIAPPVRRGRAGIYSDAHLGRLRMINQLLERGFTIANIKELVDAWEQGQDLDHVLGLDSVIAGTWSIETPHYISAEEITEIFGDEINEVTLARALRIGLFDVEEGKIKVPSPRILQAGTELHKAGVPLDALLREIEVLREDTDRLTRSFVQLVATHLVDPLTDNSLPSRDQINQIGQVIERLRPLAEMVVNAEMAKGLRRHANAYIGERFREVLQSHEGEPTRKPTSTSKSASKPASKS